MLRKNLSPSALALIGSSLISFWIFFGETSINTDGVIYLNAAKAYLDHGFYAALNIYGWPFYSILIALISNLGVSLTQSAALLNIVFFTGLAWAFVAVTERLYPQQRHIHYLAAAIILLLPYINTLRGSFFRDNGQIVCLLLSLLALLRFIHNARPLALLAWVAAVTAATLFRPESILLLPAGIIALGFNSGHKQKTLLGLLLFAIAATLSLLLLQHYAPASRVQDLLRWANYYLSEFGTTFSSKAETLQSTVLGEFSNNGKEALLASLLVTLAAGVVGALTPVHAAALWLQRNLDTGIATRQRRVLIAYAIATFLPPAIFVAYAYFISQRYILAFALILLLLVPPRLAAALADIRARPLRIGGAILVALFLIISSYRNLKIETELREAGQWLSARTGSVWTNSLPISYYIQTNDTARSVVVQNQPLARTQIDQINSDWAAIVIAKRDSTKIPQLLEQLHGTEAKRFEGGGRFVIIIRR